MKPHPAPTSPKVLAEQSAEDLAKNIWPDSKMQQPARWPWVRMILLVVLVTVVINSGIFLGLAWAVHRGYIQSWPKWLALSTTTVVESVVARNQNTVPSAVQRSTAALYDLMLDQGPAGIYTTSDLHGLAAPLSHNGWLMTWSGHVPSSGNWLALPATGAPQIIGRQVPDPSLPVMFVNAGQLSESPVSFGSVEVDRLPQAVWVVRRDLDQQVYDRRTIIARHDPRWRSSDLEDSWFELDAADNRQQGSMVFDDEGRLIGLIDRDQRMIPLASVETVLSSLLQQQTIQRPSLGITYLDRSTAVVASNLTASGLLIGAATGQAAVRAGSPADKAGLKAGDIIVSINNQPVQKRLYTILNAYQVGDSFRVQYLRDQTTKEATVVLTSLHL